MPAYRAAAAQEGPTNESGFGSALRAFGFTIHCTVAFYIFLSYMPTFTWLHAQLTPSESLWSNTIGAVALMLLIPLFGGVSDRAGRKPLLLTSCAASVVLPLPLFALILGKPGFGTIAAPQVLVAACIALFLELARRRSRRCSTRWVGQRG
jgi:MHS family proline/betaine transporter-like MFS transporter